MGWKFGLIRVLGILAILVEQNHGVGLRSRAGSDSASASGSGTNTNVLPGSDSTTCQCGVFLLGTPPLEFSADAKPILAGKSVATNCTASEDRTKCSTICRQLVQAMSNQDSSPLVQTVVLAATRTLACQRFNSSAKVPLPRIHVASSWRLDSSENVQQKRDVLSDPRWLGGFYRWCDSHWVYAGVSVHEPLCCVNGLPSKCPESVVSQRSNNGGGTNRNPRLIIKKRPEDDISSEETDNDLDTAAPSTSSPATTSSASADDNTSPGGSSEVDTESDNDTSFEKIDPIPVREPPQESKLNSTILAEAFQFVGALMRSMGMGDVAEGISTVLPTSAATELLKRVDVGGWVGKYQDRYVGYKREFNFGYCYLEYGLYNVASEGVTNMISRVFGGGSGREQNGWKHNRRIRREVADNGTTTPKRIVRPKQPYRINRKQPDASKRQGQGGSGPSVPNLLNMASMMMQMAGAAGGGGGGNGEGGGGDKVNALLQNALPMLGQVATSPMIQGVVSNLVTSFLTPPDNNGGNGQRPPKPNNQAENEIESAVSTPFRPIPQDRPSAPPQQQESGLTSMLGQIMQTYLKHVLFSPRPPPPTSPPTKHTPTKTTPPAKQSSSSSSSSTSTSTASPVAEEKTDIVDTISDVAKPFFISYFGVVPDVPGFGQLNIAERTGRIRDDTLTYDPDPGSSISDLIFGSVNLPQTGSTVYDFGNRIVFAFGRANDPTQGLYCLKQYAVNKLWDGFRVGVKTLFK